MYSTDELILHEFVVHWGLTDREGTENSVMRSCLGRSVFPSAPISLVVEHPFFHLELLCNSCRLTLDVFPFMTMSLSLAGFLFIWLNRLFLICLMLLPLFAGVCFKGSIQVVFFPKLKEFILRQ